MKAQYIQYPPTQMRLIDGANSAPGESLSVEAENLAGKIASSDMTLPAKLEAYEDIINLEVGDTNFARARTLERQYGIRQLYLKFEGNNPTGTQKDRIAFAQCLDAMRRGYETITVATCGNYGAAVAMAARLASLRAVICIPESYHTGRLGEMERSGCQVIRVPGDYEAVVAHSQNLAISNEWYDANPGGANTSLQIGAYSEIANEIYDVLRDAPKIVAAPVSNGTLLAGIHRGFVNLYKRGKTSRIPRMVAASSFRKNPIVQSYLKGCSQCEDLNESAIRETSTNEPLINWHSFDGNEALSAIQQSGGWATGVSDQKLNLYSMALRKKEGLAVLPASTAGLVGLLESEEAKSLEGDRYVAVLTGRK